MERHLSVATPGGASDAKVDQVVTHPGEDGSLHTGT